MLEEIFMVEHHSEAYLTSMGVSLQPVRTNDMYGYIYIKYTFILYYIHNIHLKAFNTLHDFSFEYFKLYNRIK